MIDYSFSYQDLGCFLLIFVRISCFIFAAPFFSTSNVPRRVKVGLSFFLSFIIFGVLENKEVPEYRTIFMYSTYVLKEAICGLLIGFGANICNYITSFSGRIADAEIGISMITLLDPSTKEQTGFTGVIYQYTVMLLMLVSNLHHYFIKAIVETFNIIPLGRAIFDSEKIVNVSLKLLSDYVMISFRICLPVVAAIMITNAVLGILVKTAPQINMFSVGIQIKMFVGLAVLFITVGVLPAASDYIFKEMKIIMTVFVESMS